MPPPPDDRPDDKVRLRELIAACLEHAEAGGVGAVEAFLATHPTDAPAIRERLAALRAAGMLVGDAREEEPFPERLGDFRLVRRLGGGGMGVVYVAVQESLQRQVALKMIRPEHLYFPGARERFRREVESVARLQHPGIVPIYVVGETNGVPFFAMELVRGKSLAEILHGVQGRGVATLTAADVRRVLGEESSTDAVDLGRSWVEAAFRVGLQVTDAMAHAHERGVLHRDIKPSNVMVTPAGRAILLDFGLASIEGGQNLTRTGHNVGSLPYMAPEQVLGQNADVGPWTDVYALGVLLFETLTLKSPFVADSSETTRARILAGELTPPHTLNPAIPWDAETICLKALHRDHRQRYRSAAELSADLRSFLELRPIAAQRPGGAEQVRTWIRRHPIKTTLGVAAAALLLAGPAAFAIQKTLAEGRVRAALDQSEQSFQRALSAVDELLKEVGGRQLRDVPQMDPVRVQLLEKATGHYAAFLAERPGDRRVRANAFHLAVQYSEALQRLGRFGDAEPPLRRALDLAEGLARETPDDRGAARLVAVAHYALGYLFLNQSRSGDATTEFKECMRRYRELVARDPDDLDLVAESADALNNLGNSFLRGGNIGQAQKVFEEARDTLARIVAAAPERSEFREKLAIAWQAIALMHRVAGKVPLARAAQEHVLETYSALPASRRSDRLVRSSEAIAYRHLGDILDDLSEWSEAEAALNRSIALREGLVADHPQVPEYRRDLAVAHMDLGERLLLHTQLPEAEAELRKAIELLDPLVKQLASLPVMRAHLGNAWMHLGRVLAGQGQAAQAIEAFAVARRLQEEAISRDPADPSYRMRLGNVAGFLGISLLSNGDHAGAVVALEESIKILSAVASERAMPARTQTILAERRTSLADACLRSGAIDRAEQVAGELASGDRDQRIAAARILARVAGARRGAAADAPASAAVALLRELLQESRRGIERSGPDFAALRGREEFEALFK